MVKALAGSLALAAACRCLGYSCFDDSIHKTRSDNRVDIENNGKWECGIERLLALTFMRSSLV